MSAQAIEVAALSGPIIDEVGLINSTDRQNLSLLLTEFNEAGKAQLQIYIIKSLQGLTIEQAGIQIVEKWKLGQAKQDNGLLFLVAPHEHKMRFEVGQGLEAVIPDIRAKEIQVDIVTPYFKANDYSGGVRAGTIELLKYIDAEFYKSHPELAGQSGPRPSQRGHSSRGSDIPLWFWIIVFVVVAVLNRFSGGGRGGGRGFYGGGSSGGSSWGGGGGGFSGGGASSDW